MRRVMNRVHFDIGVVIICPIDKEIGRQLISNREKEIYKDRSRSRYIHTVFNVLYLIIVFLVQWKLIYPVIYVFQVTLILDI